MQTAQQLAAQANEEAKLWESLTIDRSQTVESLESKLAQLQADSAAQLSELQAKAAQQPKEQLFRFQKQADKTASLINLDEKATRELIDQQLRDAGWEADAVALRYSAGTRSEPSLFEGARILHHKWRPLEPRRSLVGDELQLYWNR